jgi:hypothetical protein
MWYPNKLQWFVIWAATLVCIVCWLFEDPAPESYILPAVLVAVLFVWHVSADFNQTKD